VIDVVFTGTGSADSSVIGSFSSFENFTDNLVSIVGLDIHQPWKLHTVTVFASFLSNQPSVRSLVPIVGMCWKTDTALPILQLTAASVTPLLSR